MCENPLIYINYATDTKRLIRRFPASLLLKFINVSDYIRGEQIQGAYNMSQFEDRKRGEEAKFAMDQATDFKTMARRNKLLGLWAADLMELSGPDAEAYAKTVVLSDLEEAGDEDVFRKVRGDFDAKGIDRSDARIREQMDALLLVAREQLNSET
jgi:hypothetical protein